MKLKKFINDCKEELKEYNDYPLLNKKPAIISLIIIGASILLGLSFIFFTIILNNYGSKVNFIIICLLIFILAVILYAVLFSLYYMFLETSLKETKNIKFFRYFIYALLDYRYIVVIFAAVIVFYFIVTGFF